jgi:hypothetical protein
MDHTPCCGSFDVMRKKIVVGGVERRRNDDGQSQRARWMRSSQRAVGGGSNRFIGGGEYSNGCVARALVWYRDRGRGDDDDALSWRMCGTESRAPKKNPAARGDVEEWGGGGEMEE